MDTPPLTRAELAAAAERALRETFPRLARQGRASISERTVRFWTREGLLPPRGGPNRLGRYEPELVHRCVFIRRLGLERSLGLQAIGALLAGADDDTVRQVAAGGALPESLASAIAAPPPVGPRSGGAGAAPGEQTHAAHTASPAAPAVTPGQRAADEAAADRPVSLQALSDAERVEALADALHQATGRRYELRLLATEYAVAGYRGSFREPACVDCEVVPNASSGDAAAAVADLQRLTDASLAGAIADALSARTGDRLIAEVMLRRYLLPATLPERRQPVGLRLAVLVACATG